MISMPMIPFFLVELLTEAASIGRGGRTDGAPSTDSFGSKQPDVKDSSLHVVTSEYFSNNNSEQMLLSVCDLFN